MKPLDSFLVYRGIRTVGVEARRAWTSERRRIYLITPDVEIPISMDTRVLPEASSGEPRSDVFELCAAFVVTPESEGAVRVWEHALFKQEIPPSAETAIDLGYDVCDRVGTSGLMNCGQQGAKMNETNGYWRFALNRHHLFSSLVDADAYRRKLDKELTEHAPFAILQLFACRPE
jgi:hypothetical protein